jgi:hypothetical protein
MHSHTYGVPHRSSAGPSPISHLHRKPLKPTGPILDGVVCYAVSTQRMDFIPAPSRNVAQQLAVVRPGTTISIPAMASKLTGMRPGSGIPPFISKRLSFEPETCTTRAGHLRA